MTAVDVLGEPFEAETIELPEDDEGEVVATLVRRPASAPTGRAVLYVHGFADYFFHAGYAAWWNARGYDFYALDLRKYGRSLREHQSPGYAAALADYHLELDEAWQRIADRDGHDEIVLSAHSTGGLITALWANERQHPELVGVVYNAPWLDMQGSVLVRTVGSAVVKQLGRHQPLREIPRSVSGLYVRSLHRDYDGEWDFDLAWKPLGSFQVFAGWLRAVRHAQAEVHRGLSIDVPILVLTSARSTSPTEMGPDVHTTDIVLDVGQIRRWATSLGPRVTCISVEGARHDVVLSLPGPRAQVYAELDRWAAAYLPA